MAKSFFESRVLRLFAFAAVPIAFAGCGSGSNRLTLRSYPEGFSLKQPAGWESRVLDKGLILAASSKTDRDASFVAVYPFFLKTAVSSGAWIDKNLEALGGVLNGVRIETSRRTTSGPDETAARIRFEKDGRPFEGSALCSIDGKSGVLYVIAAPEGEFSAAKPRLLDILRSFRFGLPEASAAKTPLKPAIRYLSWEDPVERAFSLEVPAGWRVEGGTHRRASVDISHFLQAASADGRIRILFNDPDLPVFAIPNQTLAWAGFREGSWYSPGYGLREMVMRYKPGLAFLLEYLRAKTAPGLASFEVLEQKDRPDIVADFNRIMSRTQVGDIAFRLHAGDAAFRFEKDGEPGLGYGLAVTQVVQSASMPGGNWSVSLLLVYSCPEAAEEEVREVATHMFRSVRMNPEWVAGQQQLTADVSRIVTETNQAITGIINDSYWTKQGAQDNIHRKFSNATLGVTDVVDPDTGEAYKVEAGHNYYWIKSGTNQIAGTGTYTRPDIDFKPLEEF
jgi:hypothetical protein